VVPDTTYEPAAVRSAITSAADRRARRHVKARDVAHHHQRDEGQRERQRLALGYRSGCQEHPQGTRSLSRVTAIRMSSRGDRPDSLKLTSPLKAIAGGELSVETYALRVPGGAAAYVSGRKLCEQQESTPGTPTAFSRSA